VLFYVLIVCTVTLPPGVNPIAVDKYIYLSIYLIFNTLFLYYVIVALTEVTVVSGEICLDEGLE